MATGFERQSHDDCATPRPPGLPESTLKLSPAATEPVHFRDVGRLRRAGAKLAWGCAWCIRTMFGIASLILLLALLAAIPLINFFVLGYLLDVEGRVARSGRLRDAFPLIDLAPRLGSIALGFWLWLWPLRLLSNVATDAAIIAPGGNAAMAMNLLRQAAAIGVAAHLCLALARGGGLGCFFRPIKNARWLAAQWRSGAYWEHAERHVRDFVRALRIRHHLWLGVRGFAGAMCWLVVPTALLASSDKTEGASIIVTVIGGVLLVIVLSWVPFLQAHFAAENRFAAHFQLRAVRQLYKNAPFSWLFTLLITLTLALPMYFFKIALPPQDAMWLETLVFIVMIYPVKVATGWAYHRAAVREKRAFFGFRWLSRLVMAPLLVLFVFLLFFTQFIGEHGKGVLFEHHVFLLPAPF